jgi:hypothetical protein
MYCLCGKQSKGYTAAPALDGGPFDFNYEFWVCANCGKPSYLIFEGLTAMLTPHRATAILSANGRSDGTWILTWATSNSGERIQTITYHPYPRKFDMPEFDQGFAHLAKFWKSLDDCIDQIRGIQANTELVEAEKVRARTYAEVLQQLMQPFYATPNDILAESMQRWQARQDGTVRETPGLAETIWDPATRFDGTVFSEQNERKVRTAVATKPRVVLDEQKVLFIRHTLENGQMTPEVLAGMFSCTVEDIKAVVS